ncbi:MAG: hypothetical protein J7623_01325 [Chitinophaga sp.]|uniref:hypothetical protein n=1 Tax=Chitinophaga sp. TaxID=1869181 RepID=UPI001B0CD321|nr:hypothetical protein [Chitinophaga sp.]MBO9727255.1 hypothetical protein [Chitinophaga sp.]
MTKTAIRLLLLLLPLSVAAQQKKGTIRVPLMATNWDFKPGTVEFLTWQSVPAMKILNSIDTAVLKNFDFTDGTVEYDIQLVDTVFTAFFFRRASKAETECFYFRTGESGNQAAIQYAPFIGGVNLWNMMYHYQNAAWFEKQQWNHVKLLISGKQLRVYVNDMLRPALEVPRLEGNTTHGTLSFDGQAIIANLVVKPGQTEDLSPLEGVDITNNDPRYLRKWLISPVIPMSEKNDFRDAYLPDKATIWDTIRAERRGLINLTRKFGGAPQTRRLVWLKTNIHAAANQVRQLRLGFNNEVWVLVNGKFVYIDKNTYGSPIMKQPEGRCTLENSTINLPLAKGDNELLVGVANNFYGWGIIAQLDKFEHLVTER